VPARKASRQPHRALNLEIPFDLSRRIHEEAAYRGISQAALLRLAASEFVDRSVAQRRASDSPSAAVS
jgi:hypothetical protein